MPDEKPRGADGKYRVRVPREWIQAGATIDVELPRNVTCAVCDGGGCDACESSGALTLRGRRDEPEWFRVTLPRREDEAEGQPGPFVLRVPEVGGHAPDGSGLPRGNLLLTVEVGDLAESTRVRLSAGAPEPEAVAPPSPVKPTQVRWSAPREAAPDAPRRVEWIVVAVLVAVLLVLGLLFLRG